jgi:hypothetical protein
MEKKKKIVLFLIAIIIFSPCRVSADLNNPTLDEIISALKSNNLDSWADYAPWVPKLKENPKYSSEPKIEEAIQALIDLGIKVYVKKEVDINRMSTRFEGEGVMTRIIDIRRSISLLKDDRAIPILEEIGDDGLGGSYIAYFGEKIVEYYIKKSEETGDPNPNGMLVRLVNSNIPKKYPLTEYSKENIREIALKALHSNDDSNRRSAIAILGKIANPDDIPLIEKIAKEDPYCVEDISAGLVNGKVVDVKKTVCPVRKTAKKALEEIKARKENMASAQTESATATVSNPELGNDKAKPSEIINNEISKKTNASESKVAGETTKSSRTNWYVVLGVVIAIIIALSVYILIRKHLSK